MRDRKVVSLDDLREEYAREHLGVLWLAEVHRAVQTTTARFDPRVYGRIVRWSEGWDDLTQEVVVHRLLEEGQLQYIVHTATDLEHARRLLIRQVKHTLARRRDRTVIDNLLDRARALLAPPLFEAVGGSRGRRYRGAGARVVDRSPNDGELRRAALEVCNLPRERVLSGDRAPRVYTTEMLTQALHVVATSLPCTFRVGDIDRIFSQALTDFLPGALDLYKELSEQREPSLTPEEVVVVRDVAGRLWTRMSGADRTLFAMKLHGHSDAEVAAALGVSRPTAANHKQRVLQGLESEFTDLSESLQRAVLDNLAGRSQSREMRW